MPYVLRKINDNTFHVIDKVTGDIVEPVYKSHSRAVKAIRALYATEKRGKVHPWFNLPNTSS